MVYKIVSKVYTRNIKEEPLEWYCYSDSDFKIIYKSFYRWLRNQHCAMVEIFDDENLNEVCTMAIGKLGDILILNNHKLLTVREKQFEIRN